MISLVGHTGFVGSNIYACGAIDKAYNSKNISEAFGTNPDLLIYSGVRAEKFLANTNPEADYEVVKEAFENIKKIGPKQLVLISTIDVLKDPNNKTEDSVAEKEGLHAYGLNRLYLEEWVRGAYPNALIIRLPALYGINIKKNFIYDFINLVPAMLSAEKFTELATKKPELSNYYKQQPNGFYKAINLEANNKAYLKSLFKELGFTALNFTDSGSAYQFYPLSRLWKDIKIALDNKIKLLHLATEPLTAGEVYKYLTGQDFVNELGKKPAFYDYRSKYSKFFGDSEKYIMNKAELLSDLKDFVEGQLKNV